MLFETAEDATKIQVYLSQMELGSGYEDTVEYMNSNHKEFENFEEFLADCFK